MTKLKLGRSRTINGALTIVVSAELRCTVAAYAEPSGQATPARNRVSGLLHDSIVWRREWTV